MIRTDREGTLTLTLITDRHFLRSSSTCLTQVFLGALRRTFHWVGRRRHKILCGRQLSFILQACPNQPIRRLCISSSIDNWRSQRCRMYSFRSRSRSEIRNICRRHRMWKASSFARSNFSSVQHSELYSSIDKIRVRYSLILVFVVILVCFHKHYLRDTNTAAAWPIRLWISVVAAIFVS